MANRQALRVIPGGGVAATGGTADKNLSPAAALKDRMERGGGVHTVSAGWWNKVDGKVVSRHTRKDDAVEAGREIARTLSVEHTIHNVDGTIGEKNSYGNDPREIKG